MSIIELNNLNLKKITMKDYNDHPLKYDSMIETLKQMFISNPNQFCTYEDSKNILIKVFATLANPVEYNFSKLPVLLAGRLDNLFNTEIHRKNPSIEEIAYYDSLIKQRNCVFICGPAVISLYYEIEVECIELFYLDIEEMRKDILIEISLCNTIVTDKNSITLIYTNKKVKYSYDVREHLFEIDTLMYGMDGIIASNKGWFEFYSLKLEYRNIYYTLEDINKYMFALQKIDFSKIINDNKENIYIKPEDFAKEIE